MEVSLIGVHFTDVYLTGCVAQGRIDVPLSRAPLSCMYLIGVHPVGVYLIGMHFMGVHLIGVSLMACLS